MNIKSYLNQQCQKLCTLGEGRGGAAAENDIVIRLGPFPDKAQVDWNYPSVPPFLSCHPGESHAAGEQDHTA